MKFKPPSKRKKLDHPQSSSTIPPHDVLALEKREAAVMALISSSSKPTTDQNTLRIRQARDAAVAQAQQDCCRGNYRIFDSPYGNYLVPVIPTRAELGG